MVERRRRGEFDSRRSEVVQSKKKKKKDLEWRISIFLLLSHVTAKPENWTQTRT